MEFEEKVRSSFEKVREDIRFLQEELFALKKELENLRVDIKTNFIGKSSTGNEGVPTNQQTNTSTVNTPLFPVDGNPSMPSSTSVKNPAHFPTHLQQISQKTQQMSHRFQQITPEMVENMLKEQKAKEKEPQKGQIMDLAEVMDTLKSDLKKRFKSLTKQEFYIFSVLYTVEKSQESVTYSDLAAKTGLTSSSIRDYIQRIIRKGIPISKEKLNNKVTLLKIPPELRNLATLDNLLRIRKELKDESLDSFK